MSPGTRLARTLSLLGPPIALMGLIFYLSHQPDLGTGLGTLDLILRKLAHMTEYGLLWLLWLRALGWRRPWVAALIAIGYAISDEWHQSFIAGRVGSPLDVGIDAAGVLVAAVLTQRLGLAERMRDRARRRDRALAAR